MNFSLNSIEFRLKNLIEKNLIHLPWTDPSVLLSEKLVAAIQDYFGQQVEGLLAPHTYTLFMNPDNLALLPANTDWLDQISNALMESSQNSGIQFSEPPLLKLAPDARLKKEEIEIIAEGSGKAVGSTAAYQAEGLKKSEQSQPHIPDNAYFIINGTTTFPLAQNIINIGRRPENQLVIEDPRVSRSHAQLRAVRGNFILFDLNSTSGTFVNNLRVSQVTLKSGDVVSLAGYVLIYGQDLSGKDIETGGHTVEYSIQPPPEELK